MKPFFASVLLTAVVAVGSSFGSVACGTSVTKPNPAKAAILTVGSSGGFVPQGYDFRNSARNMVLGDGSHFRPGAITMQYPGSALYPLQQGRFKRTELATIDRLAGAASLADRGFDWGIPNTADVPNLTVNYRGNKHSITSFGVGEESLTPRQRSARKAVASLLAYLDKQPGTTVKPTALVMIASRADESATAHETLEARDWPTGAVPLASVGSCAVVTGPAGRAAAVFLAKQHELTSYRDRGVLYRVIARVHVPGDWGCGPQ